MERMDEDSNVTDPRNHVMTDRLRCVRMETGEWALADRKSMFAGYANWSEVVELAQKVLAANESWLDGQTVKPERQFPVLNTYGRNAPAVVRSVPWSMLAPHEPQALKNHCGQSLEKLASRGGLSPLEIYAVMNGLSWSMGKLTCTESEAVQWLAATLAEITPAEGREELSDGS